MKRTFDIVLALISLILLALPILIIAIAIKTNSKGPVVYWSDRIGKQGVIFKMPKFRSMQIGTPLIESNLIGSFKSFVTPLGLFLRRTSMDELPQLFSILKGDMSFVGHRPLIPSQNELITLRSKYGINNKLPGLTGWAQINGRDILPTKKKIALELEYLDRCSLWFDIKIIYITLFKVIKGEDISH